MNVKKGDVVRFAYSGSNDLPTRTVYVYDVEANGDIIGHDFGREDIRRFKPRKMDRLIRLPADVKAVGKDALPSNLVPTVRRGYVADGYKVIEGPDSLIAVKFQEPTMYYRAGVIIVDAIGGRLEISCASNGNVKLKTPNERYPRYVTPHELRNALTEVLGE